ncbi:MAG: type III pantothenate kinase [Bdellovibrionales bacterium]|nr:type III pantothenate kinase [Bdellovibrionales bacterium]
MLLALDIGNTNIVVGCFAGQKLVFQGRIRTVAERTVDELEVLLFSLLERNLEKGFSFSECIISSVVPPITPAVVELVKRKTGIQPLQVGPGIKTGISIKIGDPSTVGSDRVVNAVAAKELYGTPALIVDFGTATSFDFVSAVGAYEGGVIAPGLNVALDSLVEHTAKLPRIELIWPETVIGKSTVTAMQSGALVGYVCLVDGLIERIVEEVGKVEHIIATGGTGKLIAQHSRMIREYQPHLTLFGMRILAELNS